jgi:signal transduction histidine kinase
MTTSRGLERTGLSFFGEVTAGVTHDLRNSLAILKEISGLLADLADAAGEGGSVSSGRVRDIAGRLDEQVNRAHATVRLLNRFAHSVDVPVRTVDLPDTVGLLGDLARRHARRRRVILAVELPEEAPAVESDPFLLEQAIFLLLGMTIDHAEEGGTVTVTLRRSDRGAALWFTGAACGKVRIEGALSRILDRLGSTALYDGRTDTLVLEIPRRLPGGEEADHG